MAVQISLWKPISTVQGVAEWVSQVSQQASLKLYGVIFSINFWSKFSKVVRLFQKRTAIWNIWINILNLGWAWSPKNMHNSNSNGSFQVDVNPWSKMEIICVVRVWHQRSNKVLMIFSSPQFFQKTNKMIRLYYYDTSGWLVFVEDTKKHFEINWPLGY